MKINQSLLHTLATAIQSLDTPTPSTELAVPGFSDKTAIAQHCCILNDLGYISTCGVEANARSSIDTMIVRRLTASGHAFVDG